MRGRSHPRNFFITAKVRSASRLNVTKTVGTIDVNDALLLYGIHCRVTKESKHIAYLHLLVVDRLMCVVGEAGGKLLVFVSPRQLTSAPADYLLVRCAIWACVPTSGYSSGYRVMPTLVDPLP